jgi:hypothetical protein
MQSQSQWNQPGDEQQGERVRVLVGCEILTIHPGPPFHSRLVYMTIDPLGTFGASSSLVTSIGWKTSIWLVLAPIMMSATLRATAALAMDPLSMAVTRMRSCQPKNIEEYGLSARVGILILVWMRPASKHNQLVCFPLHTPAWQTEARQYGSAYPTSCKLTTSLVQLHSGMPGHMLASFMLDACCCRLC